MSSLYIGWIVLFPERPLQPLSHQVFIASVLIFFSLYKFQFFHPCYFSSYEHQRVRKDKQGIEIQAQGSCHERNSFLHKHIQVSALFLGLLSTQTQTLIAALPLKVNWKAKACGLKGKWRAQSREQKSLYVSKKNVMKTWGGKDIERRQREGNGWKPQGRSVSLAKGGGSRKQNRCRLKKANGDLSLAS